MINYKAFLDAHACHDSLSSTFFQPIFDINITNDISLFSRSVEAARRYKKLIFGIKGLSALSSLISLSIQVYLDPMHMIFEGVMKMFIGTYLDTKYRYLPYYLARPNTLEVVGKGLVTLTQLVHFFHKETERLFW